jgi:alpha-D-xyloside xylohydrolase
MQSLGNCADYYFLYGGNADGVIRLMRNLTGQAPMIPLWGFGFFQCRERYKTQEEIIGVVEKYRELEVPLDCVIQDWQYWGNNDNWNSMGFDPSRFPDPKKMADTIHRMNSKIMISVWPSFGVSTELFQAYSNNNMLIDIKTWPMNCPARSYDAYNPKARDMYWDKLNQEIFSLGFDALWLDGVEPIHKNPEPQDFDVMTHAGAFERVKNVYPLLTCEGVYKNWRKTTAEKRVLLLPRSGFAGQQRTGSVVWSGDVQSEWSVLRKQISAGLNFSLCAAPYWNTDIGGFFAGRFNTCTPGAGASVQEQELASEKKPFYTHGGEKNPEFQELYVRWMQFGAFTPVMRSHGTFVPREIYQFGERGEWPFDIQEQYINLRYSLLPYIYSTAWDVTCNAGTFMRALMMDFPADSNVWDLDDEYLFGRSILVAPVTEFGQTEKKVYLPKGSAWYDFWTFEKFEGGTETVKAAPKDVLPLFVRAGSIIPRGPKVQYSTEKDWSVLDIHLYPGANGEFVLYEDEFDNYNYESGCYSEIRMLWNEQEQTLTICDRKGTFRGMLTCRRFNLHFPGQEAKSCVYSGSEVKIPF